MAVQDYFYVDYPANGIDINESLGKSKVAFPEEKEILVPDSGIPNCNIIGCQPVNANGTPKGDYIINPNYVK